MGHVVKEYEMEEKATRVDYDVAHGIRENEEIGERHRWEYIR